MVEEFIDFRGQECLNSKERGGMSEFNKLVKFLDNIRGTADSPLLGKPLVI